MNKVKVLLRLPVPEGRPGDHVVVSESRARLLVDSKYATFIELAEETADDTLDAVEPEKVDADSGAATPDPKPAAEPATELPAKSATKGEWEGVAASLGIDTTDMNKDEVVEAVTNAVE